MIREGFCSVELKLTTSEGCVEFKETIDEIATCCKCEGHCDLTTALIYSDMNINIRNGKITHYICTDCADDKPDYSSGGTD